jgi:HrpA-like RNA helicase
MPEDFELRAYFGNAKAVNRGDKSYDVEVRFLPKAAALVTETSSHHTQKVRTNQNGSVTLCFPGRRLGGDRVMAARLVGLVQ